ncbi:hexose kinase [Enterococcus sp. LJL98]
MILTVTLNPSIDISYPLAHLQLDTVNRVMETQKTVGGKGLNVTRVLHQLEREVLATGLLGGHHGAFIESQLEQEGIGHDFAEIAEETRNSIAILHDNGQQTEILEAGPMISEEELSRFEQKFLKNLVGKQVVTLSGSVPQGVPTTYYRHLVALAKERGVAVLLDTSGDSLRQSLTTSIKPDLIKPNLEELTGLLNEPLSLENLEALKEALNQPLFEGVDWVVITLGGDGALVKHQSTFYRVLIPTIEVVNPVGSGDATIAGFAAALSQGAAVDELLKTGMATGMLNALEKRTGQIAVENFEQLKEQIEVVEV